MIKNTLYIVWNDANNIGISIIDEQHRAIIATINTFYYFLQKGYGVEALTPTLNIIKLYMKFHAKTEEGLLVELGYPKTKEDVLAYDYDMKEFNRMSQEAIANRDPELLLKFLRHWWQKHLADHQAKYSRYLKID